ncbi:MAG: peptidylprolyl isomerase [Bacilli bacterium]
MQANHQRKAVKMVALSTVLLLILAIVGCNGAEPKNSGAGESDKEEKINNGNPIVTMEMENGKNMKIELYPEIAPNTVSNFISLIEKGYYDGLIFHRIIPEFMIQGGDPQGTGRGNPGYSIKGEFLGNGFENNLSHERGVISMARSGEDPDSAGSQFFIVVADSTFLDGQYASFGKVIEGMETADEIVIVERNKNEKPLEDQKIKKVTVEAFGKEYGKPETISR